MPRKPRKNPVDRLGEIKATFGESGRRLSHFFLNRCWRNLVLATFVGRSLSAIFCGSFLAFCDVFALFREDNDGLADEVETNTGIFNSPTDTGTDPLNADTDGDGIDDGAEVAAGTDPTDDQSSPPIPVPTNHPAALWILLVALTAVSGLALGRTRSNSGGFNARR